MVYSKDYQGICLGRHSVGCFRRHDEYIRQGAFFNVFFEAQLNKSSDFANM